MRTGQDQSFIMGLHILKLPASEDLVFNRHLVLFGRLYHGSSSDSRSGLPGDWRFSVGYGVQLCRTPDWGRLNRRLPLRRCHERRGPGPPLPLRSPFDGEPAKRSADGRAAEPVHDVSLSSGKKDASEPPLSAEFENGFYGVCRQGLSHC